MYDVVIIGAGITGTMLARDLSRYCLKVALIDRENDIANGATMANSAIIHTGYDPEDGTLKAKLNVRGARLYPQLCRDISCYYKVVGAYIAAVDQDEEKILAELARRAEERGIVYEWLSGDEARRSEPNMNDAVTKVLSFPETAIVYPWMVAMACAEVAVGNGVELYLNHTVTDIDRNENGFTVTAGEDKFDTKIVVNAAGVHAADIYGMVTPFPWFSMKPKKGEYFVLDSDIHYVDHIIYPVPSAKGKGVLAVPTVFGNTLLGPDSTVIPDGDDRGTTFSGLEYVRQNIGKIMKNVPYGKTIRNFAGVRPSSTCSDFIIEEAEDVPGFINAAGIESPGIASSPGISEYIIHEILSSKLELVENEKAVMTRKAPVVMRSLSEEERNAVIKQDPRYAHMICRCCQISEGEIRDAIHGPCGARSVKGVKKRVGAGFGRCQGGFCEPRVVNILAEELGISPLDVVLDGPDSRILAKENR